MSSPAFVSNGNQLQGLSAAQLEQLTTITSLAKGSGLFEEKKGGEGFMGSFVDSATGQKHYIKMLTHGNERDDARGENAQEANLLSGSKGLGEMTNSMKADLLELARAVGVENKVKNLFNSPKKNDCFKDLVSRKIALEAAKLIGDAHNDKSGVNGVRFDWKAVARAEKSGDTTLGNVLLMKERNLMEGIKKEIEQCDREIKPARTKKGEIVKWIDNHEKMTRIKGCEEALQSAYAKKKNFVNGIDFLSTTNYDAIKGIRDCDKEIKDCKDALKSAKSGVKEEEYQTYKNEFQKHVDEYPKMKDELGKFNSIIDRCESKRDSLVRNLNDLKSDIEKVERGVLDVDTLARKIEEKKLSSILNKTDVSKEETELKESLNAPGVGIKGSKSINWDEKEEKIGMSPERQREREITKLKNEIAELKNKITFYDKDIEKAKGEKSSYAYSLKNTISKDEGLWETMEKQKNAVETKINDWTKERAELETKLREKEEKLKSINPDLNKNETESSSQKVLSLLSDLTKELGVDSQKGSKFNNLPEDAQLAVNTRDVVNAFNEGRLRLELDVVRKVIWMIGALAGCNGTTDVRDTLPRFKDMVNTLANTSAVKEPEKELRIAEKREPVEVDVALLLHDLAEELMEGVDPQKGSEFNNLPENVQLVVNARDVVNAFNKGTLQLNSVDKDMVASMIGALEGCNGTPDVLDTLSKLKDTVNTLANAPAVQEQRIAAENAERNAERNAEAIKGALPRLNALVEELKAGDDAELVIKFRDKANELLKDKGQLSGATVFGSIVSALAKSNGMDDAISTLGQYRSVIRGMFPDNS